MKLKPNLIKLTERQHAILSDKPNASAYVRGLIDRDNATEDRVTRFGMALQVIMKGNKSEEPSVTIANLTWMLAKQVSGEDQLNNIMERGAK